MQNFSNIGLEKVTVSGAKWERMHAKAEVCLQNCRKYTQRPIL
jgi:hypothetical protein